MSVFFTADTHFGHTNVIKHCKRPYGSIEEHDEALINNWNSMVGRNDIVYVIGDFAWKNHNRFISALKGRKILILGSHDKMGKDVLKNFTEVHPVRTVSINGNPIWLQHCCPRVWEKCHYGIPCFFGHSHGRLRTFNLSFDVGVDCWEYKPVPWETMAVLIKDRTAEMDLAGRIVKEDGKTLYRQDDVRWLMDRQGLSSPSENLCD